MVATDVIGTWIKKKYFIFGQSDSNFQGKKDNADKLAEVSHICKPGYSYGVAGINNNHGRLRLKKNNKVILLRF